MTTVLLLVASNIFMTFAWYGHLKSNTETPLWKVVPACWAIAFFEYCLMVPANRIGNAQGYTAFQLKLTQEVITILVFIVFAKLYFGESLRWNHLAAFGCVLGAVYFTFLPGAGVKPL